MWKVNLKRPAEHNCGINKHIQGILFKNKYTYKNINLFVFDFYYINIYAVLIYRCISLQRLVPMFIRNRKIKKLNFDFKEV